METNIGHCILEEAYEHTGWTSGKFSEESMMASLLSHTDHGKFAMTGKGRPT